MQKTTSSTISLAQLASTIEAELSCDFAPFTTIEGSQVLIRVPTEESAQEAENTKELKEDTLEFSVPSQASLHRQQELLSWLTNLGNRLPPYQGNKP
jgi:hypothetical protein